MPAGRPPGGGPARTILPVRVHIPRTPGLIRDGLLVPLSVLGSYNQALRFSSSLLRHCVDRHSILVIYPPAPTTGRAPPRATRSRVPRSQRLSRLRFALITRIARRPRLAPSLPFP
jgi:hypothetical protein